MAPGHTEILTLWKLAAEIDLLGLQVLDDPTLLDAKQWQVNREINKRALACAHELLKLLDDGKDTIADYVLTLTTASITSNTQRVLLENGSKKN